MNPFKYSSNNKRYHTLDYFYKEHFNSKVFKVSLNAGFTCPNIDGTVGTGGCIYCSTSGSGEYAGDVNDPLLIQFENIKTMIHKKWPTSKYIGYFQAHTNTYANVESLKAKYEPILKLNQVVGLSIATRADAIDDGALTYLEELNKRTYLTVELGLQTIHEVTALMINRGHNLKCFDDMVAKLHQRKINIVVHIINGLPYETKEMMIETINHLNRLPIQGIKIHMLHILKKTKLAEIFAKNPFPILTKEQYVNIVCDQLENLRPEIVINRITGDPKVEDLIEPTWLIRKFGVLNDIDSELLSRNTYQGFNQSILNQARRLIENNTKDNDLTVDATIGNGYDTLFLSQLTPKGHVFGFDIQEVAIANTTKLLNDYHLNNYTLYLNNHQQMAEILAAYHHKISTIIFNLGYLPKGDKKITTTSDETITAIKAGYTLLNDKGIIIIIVYPGHPAGLEESIKLKEFLTDYNHEYYYNTDNLEAPYLIQIKKS